jgi:ABC-2 type transport system permease protein
MKKIWFIAKREFLATVMAKGFLFGILLTPAILVVVIFLFPRIITKNSPRVDGQIAIYDPTGHIAGELAAYLSPEQIIERRKQSSKQLKEMAAKEVGGNAALLLGDSKEEKIEEAPQIATLTLPTNADIEREKNLLRLPPSKGENNSSSRLALVVLHPDVVRRANGKESFGSYDLFVRSKLDTRFIDEIQSGLQVAIGVARLRASGIDPAIVKDVMAVDRGQVRTITAEGEQRSNRALNAVLPFAFMILLLISVLTSASSLLTTTIEEKSNRIVEILLSAVSSMELMTGKILGQMAVGFLILLLYSGLGLMALASFAMAGLLDPMLLVYLLIFFILAYFTVAALMAAIGSAVSELRDAQSLMMPIMVIFMVPWLLMAPISNEPNSLLAIVLSFIPPIGNFIMVLRMASNTPPAMWQIGLAMLVSAVGAYLSLRFAAKIFRIGILMFGKPPTLATLIRWARISE